MPITYKAVVLRMELVEKLKNLAGERSISEFLCGEYGVKNKKKATKNDWIEGLDIGEGRTLQDDRKSTVGESKLYRKLRSSQQYYEQKLNRKYRIDSPSYNVLRFTRIQ